MVIFLTKLVTNSLLFNKGIRIHDGCQSCPKISAIKIDAVLLNDQLLWNNWNYANMIWDIFHRKHPDPLMKCENVQGKLKVILEFSYKGLHGDSLLLVE